MSATITDLLNRWASPEGHPYKGSLIDWAAYEADPASIGCMCAQGQALHLLAGWTPKQLSNVDQSDADKATAKLLGISVAHAILLRSINDKVDGAPGIVLTNPEMVIGDQAPTILAFWRHLDRMTNKNWVAVGAAAWAAAGDAARAAAWAAAGDAARAAVGAAAWAAAWAAAGDAAGDAAWDAAWDAARDAVGAAAWDAARDAVGAAAWDAVGAAARAAARDAVGAAAWAAEYAVAEIMGANVLRERGQPFFFLPLFGFADPDVVLAADAKALAA